MLHDHKLLKLGIIFLITIIFVIGLSDFSFAQQMEQQKLLVPREPSTEPEPQKNGEKIPWDYTEIVSVIIATVGGAVTTYATTYRWQRYRQKVEMVNEILDAYRDSAKKFAVLQDTLALFLSLAVSDETDAKKLLTSNEIDFTFKKFPTEPSKSPFVMFAHHYYTIEQEIVNIRNNASRYITKVRLNSDQTELVTKFQEIQRRNIYTWLLVEKMYYSNDKTEFARLAREYQDVFTVTKEKISQLENSLVNLKIHKKPF